MDRQEFVAASTRGGLITASAFGLQFIVGFGAQAVLARMLEPAVFGALAFASMVAMAFNAFTNMHGDKFVIRALDDAHRNLDSAFTLELCLATAFCLGVCLAAPFLMRLLGKEDLTLLVQVMSLAFFYNPLSRPRCLLERQLSFFRAKFPLIAAQLLAAALAITLAHRGFGIWSLVAWRLASPAVEVAIHWSIAPYRPRLAWDTEVVRGVVGFGWPLVGAAVLVFFYYNIDYYIVGQTLEDGTTQLGYYWLAFTVAAYFLKAREVFHSVLFPIFSRLEDEPRKSAIFRKMTRVVGGAFLLPTMFAVFFGRGLILTVFGEHWEPAVFPFQVIFLVILTRSIAGNAGYYLYSHGITRADLEMAALYSVLLGPLAYVATRAFGIDGTAVAVLAVTLVVVTYVFTRYIKPLAGVGPLHFFLRPWLVAAATFGLMHLCRSLSLGVGAQVAVFAGLLLLAWLLVLRPVVTDLRNAGVLRAAFGHLPDR